jgi:hypothetical protein
MPQIADGVLESHDHLVSTREFFFQPRYARVLLSRSIDDPIPLRRTAGACASAILTKDPSHGHPRFSAAQGLNASRSSDQARAVLRGSSEQATSGASAPSSPRRPASPSAGTQRRQAPGCAGATPARSELRDRRAIRRSRRRPALASQPSPAAIPKIRRPRRDWDPLRGAQPPEYWWRDVVSPGLEA